MPDKAPGHHASNKRIQKAGRWRWLSSRAGAFSGDTAAGEGDFFREMWTHINRGQFPHNTSAFSIDVEAREARIGEEKEPAYQGIWIKTSDGAYTVVKTYTTEPGAETPEPAYVLLFCPDPSVLGRCFLYDQHKGFEQSKEAKRTIQVISARRERDITMRVQRVGKDFNDPDFEKASARIDFSWVRRDVAKHSVEFDQGNRRHGILVHKVHKEKGIHVWQSVSSAFWLEEEKRGNAGERKYHLYYYANQIHTNDGFLSGGALDDSHFRAYLKPLSIRLTKEALPYEEAHDLVRRKSVLLTNAILSGDAPYTIPAAHDYTEEKLTEEHKFGKRLSLLLKANSLRLAQKLGAAATNIDTKSLAVSLVSTGILYAAASVPILLGVVATAKPNVILNAPAKLWNSVSRHLFLVNQARIRPDRDIAERFHFTNGNRFAVEGRKSLLDVSFIPHMRPVDARRFERVYQMKKFSPESEIEWGMSILLDTMGGHAGTIFSKRVMHGDIWIEAEQPNGVTIAYNARLKMALARITGDVLPGSVREKPVTALFEKALKPGDNELCVFVNDEGNLETHSRKHGEELPPFTSSKLHIGDSTPSTSAESFMSMMSKRPKGALANMRSAAQMQLCAAFMNLVMEHASGDLSVVHGQRHHGRHHHPAYHRRQHPTPISSQERVSAPAP